jgi:CheY-like chemotaxis protein
MFTIPETLNYLFFVKQLFNNKTILVVDDDPSSVILLYELIVPLEITVLKATSGHSALSSVLENTIDLILLDLKLGDTSGFLLLPKIKKINPSICVIAQTAFAYQDDIERCIEAGFDDYISKPIHSALLFSLLEKYLLS